MIGRGRREQTRRRQALEAAVAAIKAPHLHRGRGAHRVTVMNPKGGVGKTVTAAAVAHWLAEYRGEIVAVVDGNPHTGTLRRRLVAADVEPPWSIVHLAAQIATDAARSEWAYLHAFHDLVGRLRVFSNASADPGVVEAMTGEDYGSVVDLISRSAQIVVEDMGTSVMGEVAVAGLDTADTLVLATDLTQDTLELTIELVTALAGQPQTFSTESVDYSALADGRYTDLVSRAIVVVGPSRDEDRDPIDMAPMLDWLAQACAGVIVVGRDQHLAAGDLIDWNRVDPDVQMAHLQIAARVAEQFPLTTSRRR